MNLLMISTKKVTVQPSATSNPASVWITWPLSTNKVTMTIECSSYHAKVILKTSDGVEIGMMEMKKYANEVPAFWVHCREGGNKDWYGGKLLTFPTAPWGICTSETTEKLIMEWTPVELKVMKSDVELFSRKWSATEGRCLLEPGFWNLQNIGSTVASAESILGMI